MRKGAGGEAAGARRRAGRGLVSVLLGTAVLALVGFVLGIGAGLVMEEPGLLVDYLTGRTTPAPLATPPTSASAPPAVPGAAATPPAAGGPGLAEPPGERPATPPAGTAPDHGAAAPPPRSAGDSGRDRSAPRATAEAGLPAVDSGPAPAVRAPRAAPPPGGKVVARPAAPAEAERDGYAVQVGALADAASAEQLAARLRKRGYAVYVAPSLDGGSKRWRVRVGPVGSRDEAERLAARLAKEKLPTWVLAEGR